MFDRVDAKSIDDLLLPMSRRGARGVFFARVCAWNEAVKAGIWAYHEAARRRGVILDQQIQNPDGQQLEYLNDVLGDAFEVSEVFLQHSLAKWTPRMSEVPRRDFARAIFVQLEDQRRQGKTESVQRNIYAKLMCWLYYKFERLTPLLGDDDPPRILYECRAMSAHELVLLRLLSAVGADILLLEPDGDDFYLKRDPCSACSQLLVPVGEPFPKNFSLKRLRGEFEERRAQTAAIDPLKSFMAPSKKPCTNAWMREADYNQILTPVASRSGDPSVFCNAFIRVRGVNDKTTCVGELHQFYQRLMGTGRRVYIADGGLDVPQPEAIAAIRRRGKYGSAAEMIVDMAGNLPASASVELQRMMQRAFVDTLQAAQAREGSLQRLLNAAVYLLCRIRRYQGELFKGYRDGDMPCFVLMGGCANAVDALYPQYLSRLPVDVLIFAPDLNRPCALADDRLLELSGQDSLPLVKFPRDAGTLQMDTLASQAQGELTDMLYADTGMYRNHQFSHAEALTLRTTCDELFILWKQALKYRTGFAVSDDMVTMPVIYAKICGVEGGDTEQYWWKIKKLLGGDHCLMRPLPMLASGAANRFQTLAVKGVRNGKLQRGVICEDGKYPFAMLRKELQEHILDKVQLMLDRRLIKGTFENGTEYTVLSTVLNMDAALLRMLQSFDFSKTNPKLVCVCVDDRGASLEDAIMITFLNLAGFDVALFVPTGYQVIERHLRDNFPVEHQIGEYLYDLTVPNFDTLPEPKKRSLLDFFTKRGH